MHIPARDLSIINHIFRFTQLTSNHIQQLVFTDHTSHTPADRTLRRLVDDGYLARIERRIVGGTRGGSGQYVYQLGLEGHKLCRDGRYIPARAIRPHSLAIADCHVMLKRLERAGSLKVGYYATERDGDCHVTIGKYELKPDLYEELTLNMTGRSFPVMFEVDMGTQGKQQILGKFNRYWGAYQAADEAQWPEGQVILFIAVDDARAQELRWLRTNWLRDNRIPDDENIIRVETLATLEPKWSST